MSKTNEFCAIDFFCGGGGMTHGLRQAGIHVVGGIDFDLACKTTYEDNNPGTTFIHSDITKLPNDYFEKNLNILRNDDNLILVGCSPCQYYSIINTSREKARKSKDLLREFKRFVDYYNPGFVLVENVPGLASRHDSVLPEFLDFLEKKQYRYEWKIVNMSYYGVPQSRKRFSLIASRLGEVYLPAPDQEQAKLVDFIGEAHGFQRVEAGHSDKSDFMHSVSKLNDINLRRLMKTPHDGGSRLAWKDDEELQLPCYIGKDHSFTDVYGRLRWNTPSSTITTGFYKISCGRFAHPEENRGLSIREGATLQTFPHNYIFKGGSLVNNARIIGNAVPPEYGRRLGLLLQELKKNYHGTIQNQSQSR